MVDLCRRARPFVELQQHFADADESNVEQAEQIQWRSMVDPLSTVDPLSAQRGRGDLVLADELADPESSGGIDKTLGRTCPDSVPGGQRRDCLLLRRARRGLLGKYGERAYSDGAVDAEPDHDSRVRVNVMGKQ